MTTKSWEEHEAEHAKELKEVIYGSPPAEPKCERCGLMTPDLEVLRLHECTEPAESEGKCCKHRPDEHDRRGVCRHSYVTDVHRCPCEGLKSPTAPPAESVEDAKALLPQQVEGADGWTPWIEPTNRHAYMVQCCGCDLVHKFQIIPVEGTRNGQGELTDFKELTDVPVILRATVSGADPLSKTDKTIQEEADEFDAKGDAWDAFLMRKNPTEYSDSYAGFQFGWNAAIKYATKQIERQTPAIISRFVDEVENSQANQHCVCGWYEEMKALEARRSGGEGK